MRGMRGGGQPASCISNLIAGMPQQSASYKIRPDQFRIDIYIGRDQTIVIHALKDNNFSEWLSVGKLIPGDAAAGACIRHLLEHSPLPTTCSLYWTPFEEATQMKYRELFVFYQHVTVRKGDASHFVMNGKRVARDASPDRIQQRLLQLHEEYRIACKATDEPAPTITRLQQVLAEIRTMEQACPLPELLGNVSDHARAMFAAMKHQYALSPHEEVRSLLYELFQLHSSIYNRHMTAVR
ncbi:hypothetical protein PaecuDRAFT_1815 [Paenibacillus curdlanolyticus YK9]|uniref:Uncharacterized protein n=1 Tax=Paenibacillus curdlanolyticus YK9 TaxID=717606 RepID=E0I864_9BACL|nr:hypothetical protein [Paenibacillus curdlanolyticus]EFM11369.1 hypothetical protein PaecuDRAFT_1815 [Paenibacillus curdlanolyticus YK9]